MHESARRWLRHLADEIERAERQSAPQDDPRGARYIVVSDTLAQQLVRELREIADEED